MRRFIITVLVATVLHAVACILVPPFEFAPTRLACFFWALRSGIVVFPILFAVLLLPLRAGLHYFMPQSTQQPKLQTYHCFVTRTLLLCVLIFAGMQVGAWDYGNGRHGAFVLTTNVTIEQLYQTVRFSSDPPQYNPADSNAIPNFQTLILTNNASLTANPWNGSAGGVVEIKVQGLLSIAAGSSINVNGLGYRGGTAYIQGESYAGSPNSYVSPNYGGGGGGGTSDLAAGGGGYGSPGGHGNTYLSQFFGSLFLTYGNNGGSGGLTYGGNDMATLYLGSGGGGGAAPNFDSATGGNGGGAIAVLSHDLEVDGQITANGSGPAPPGGTSAGSGGGGSGGSILLQVVTANLGDNNVTASGGLGLLYGHGENGVGDYGGNGGDGRVRLEYAEAYTGTTMPAATIYSSGDSDDSTIISSQPMAQTNFLGSNVVFSIGVSGLSPLTFQWYFNDVLVPGGTNQSLFLSDLAATNQGTYSVTISNVVR